MRKYFLLDRGILVGYQLQNAVIQVNELKKDTANNPLFREEFFADPPKPWEIRYDNGYPNVIYDPKYKIYRCYYTMITYDESAAETPLAERPHKTYVPKDNRIASLGYAESRDGIHFVKPDLGVTDFGGNKENNILLRYAHGTGVFLDEQETDPAKRYKLVTKIEYCSARHHMAVAFSEDGIHFTPLQEWPEHNPATDSHNFVFRDRKTNRFVLITRVWKNGVRICAKCESDDFLNWSEPVEVLRGDGFENEVYSMPVFQYEGLYFELASMYHNGDRYAENFDKVDVELKFATKPDFWDSAAKGQYVIPRGKGTYPQGQFDCGCIYASAPIEADGKLWIYYMGGNGPHTGFRETSFARGYLEKDKFAGYVQQRKEAPGKIITSHFCVYGDSLSVLAEIGEKGYVKVGLGTKDGAVYPGFEPGSCVLERQEDGYYKVCFPDHTISELRTRPVSVHFIFEDAKIYAFRGDLECQMLKY